MILVKLVLAVEISAKLTYNMKHEFIKDIHYYLDGNKVVFTEAYFIQRGVCCGSSKDGCRHCPFTKPVKKGNTELEVKKK